MDARNNSSAGTEGALSPHEIVRDSLVEFVAAEQLGPATTPLPRHVVDHLAQCESCREWLAEVTDLAADAYSDRLPAAASYPSPDLSFLEPPSPESAYPSALLDTLGRIVVSFPHSFLATLSRPAVAGALRGQFVFRQRFELEQLPNMVVTVEVTGRHAEDAATLCVGCELLNYDPLEQAGTRVVVRTREAEWHGTTDESGSVGFDDVPLAMLPGAYIEIESDRPG